MATQFDLTSFLRRADGVAAALSASDVFGLMTRTFDLPAQWAALVTRASGARDFVSPGAVIDGEDAEEVFFVRTSPVDVAINVEGIISQDRFQFQADVQLRVQAIADGSELQSFRDTVLGSYRIATVANLSRFFTPGVRAALAKIAAASPAAEMADGSGLENVTGAVREAVEGPCFTAGLTIAKAPVVQLESRGWAGVKNAEERAASKRLEHEALQQLRDAEREAQREHLDHVSKLLCELRSLAEASPDVSLPDLLRTFPEQQRGALYQALFAAAATTDGARTAWIVVSAGDELLFFDPQHTESPDRRIPIEGDAGPVRSVQSVVDETGAANLWLGAARGVYRLPIDSAAPDLTLLVDNVPDVRGGFNAVVAVGGWVVASHSELGIAQWDSAAPTRSRQLFETMTRGAKAVRGVTVLDGHFYCSIDDRIICWDLDGKDDRPTRVYTGSLSTIASLQPVDGGLYAGTSEGDVLYWEDSQDTRPQRIHTGQNRAAESIWVVGSQHVRRLIYTDTSLHVHAKVVSDSFACRYEAGGQTLRRVEVAADILVATNDLRDRLLCWSAGQPDRPTSTIAVSQICQRSIQDVCLLPRA